MDVKTIVTAVNNKLKRPAAPTTTDKVLLSRLDQILEEAESSPDGPVAKALLSIVTKLKVETQQWAKPLAMVTLYTISHTIPRTRHMYSIEKLTEKFFGEGHSTLKKYHGLVACDHYKHFLEFFDAQVAAISELPFDDALEKIVGLLSNSNDPDEESADPKESYVYILLDPRFVDDLRQASSPEIIDSIFYVGKGTGNRLESHQTTKSSEIRYCRMRFISQAARGYIPFKVFKNVSDRVALNLEGLLIRAVAKAHPTEAYFEKKAEYKEKKPTKEDRYLTNATKGAHSNLWKDETVPYQLVLSYVAGSFLEWAARVDVANFELSYSPEQN